MVTAKSRPKGVNRWSVAARTVAAIPANYVLTSLGTAGLARLLPLRPEEASIAATLFSFAVFAAIAIAAFAVRSVARLWLWMMGAGVALSGALWLSIATGGRL